MLFRSEPHYTASKLYPALLSRRPIIALYHHESSVVETLRRAAPYPAARLITYTDTERAESRVDVVYAELVAMLKAPAYEHAVSLETVKEVSAESLAGKLAQVFFDVARTRATD